MPGDVCPYQLLNQSTYHRSMLQELVEARGIVSEAYTIDRVFLRLLKGGLELGRMVGGWS
jgi:hypothetical protein